MNFFEHQGKARKNTYFLVFCYFLTIAIIVSLIYLTVVLLSSMQGEYSSFNGSIQQDYYKAGQNLTLWQPSIFFSVLLGTLSIIGLGSLLKIYALSSGGKVIAESLSGKPILSNTSDPLERRLLNVVEEMAIASGTPVPQVYVLDSENGINAFAAGNSLDDAVIGVTRGCMNLLSRDELQGVIAHEFSHILNGDMKMNLRLIGVLSGLVILSQIGYWAFRLTAHRGGRGRQNSKDGGAQIAILVVGFVVMVLGYIGVFFARIIKSAVSRQREYLADASAVQFTRNPEGISGALKKIGGLSVGSKLDSEDAEQASHMFFATGLSFSSIFATHPPLNIRVKRIDPAFKGDFSKFEARTLYEKSLDDSKKEQVSPANKNNRGGVFSIPGMEAVRDTIGGPLGGAISGASLVGLSSGLNDLSSSSNKADNIESAEGILSSIGNPSESHIEYAKRLRALIPENILAAAHEPVDARALVYCLLIVSSSADEGLLLEHLKSNADSSVYNVTSQLLGDVKNLGLEFRIPLIDMTIPGLKSLSESQLKVFNSNILHLIKADESLSLFEYVLSRILTKRLHLRDEQSSRSVSDDEKERSSIELLATVARFGNDVAIEQDKAFASGLEVLEVSSTRSIASIPLVSFKRLEVVLDNLSSSNIEYREKLLKACLKTIWSDSEVSLEEAEIFRAISDTFDIPVPPIWSTSMKASRLSI